MKKEYRSLLVIFILSLCAIYGKSQSENIKIIADNKTEENYLKVHDFYLTHYLYIDLFLRENLYVDAKEEDVAYILNKIKSNVSKDTPLEVEIDLGENKIYKLRIGILSKGDEEILVAFTNYNPNTKKIEKEFGEKSYTRWYFLNNEKMTYRKDMSTENDYSKMIDIDLVNAYLFDELVENDAKIESALLRMKAENENENIEDQLTAELILLKYCIYKSETTKIPKVIENIKEELEKNQKNGNLKGIEYAFNATEFQLRLINLMTNS